jgi:PAS domain S-box-containing protein
MVSRDWVISVEVPVFKNGEPFRALSVSIRAKSFSRLLNDRHIPEFWLVCIIDQQGHFIVREPGHERNVGQLAPEGFRKIKDQEGIFEFLSAGGDPIVAANTLSAASRWPVAVAVRKAEMQAAAWNAIRWATVFGGGFSIFSLLFAAAIARSITRPIEELRKKASVLLAEPAPGLPLLGPPEVRELCRALKQSAAKRDHSEQALRASEERFRGIFEHAATGIAIGDMEGRYLSGNPAFCSMLGYTNKEVHELTIRELVHPEDFEACMSNFRRLVAEELSSFEILNRYVAKDGKPIWVHKHVSLLRDDRGTPVNALALVTDMTERKQYEDHIRLLMHEVNHRSKNLLTVVQAVARQTIAADPQGFLDRFGMRIEALAAGQDLLVKNSWKGVDLNELTRSQLAPFEDLIGTRIVLHGQAIFVSAHAAQTIGMALHELATNAGKYGALIDAEGRVEITWRLQRGEGEEAMFVITWREESTRPVRAPVKLGFGCSVICELAEMSLGAKVELDFFDPGLTWRLRCAAVEILEGSLLTTTSI